MGTKPLAGGELGQYRGGFETGGQPSHLDLGTLNRELEGPRRNQMSEERKQERKKGRAGAKSSNFYTSRAGSISPDQSRYRWRGEMMDFDLMSCRAWNATWPNLGRRAKATRFDPIRFDSIRSYMAKGTFMLHRSIINETGESWAGVSRHGVVF